VATSVTGTKNSGTSTLGDQKITPCIGRGRPRIRGASKEGAGKRSNREPGQRGPLGKFLSKALKNKQK